MKFITGRQDKNLLPALLAACIGIVLLGVKVSEYIFNNEKWVVEPALVADRSGARMFSYNPRINILMNRLQAGNLLDRKGMILATSNPSQIKPQTDSTVVAWALQGKILKHWVIAEATVIIHLASKCFFGRVMPIPAFLTDR